jgi:hypothetical protein
LADDEAWSKVAIKAFVCRSVGCRFVALHTCVRKHALFNSVSLSANCASDRKMVQWCRDCQVSCVHAAHLTADQLRNSNFFRKISCSRWMTNMQESRALLASVQRRCDTAANSLSRVASDSNSERQQLVLVESVRRLVGETIGMTLAARTPHTWLPRRATMMDNGERICKCQEEQKGASAPRKKLKSVVKVVLRNRSALHRRSRRRM